MKIIRILSLVAGVFFASTGFAHEEPQGKFDISGVLGGRQYSDIYRNTSIYGVEFSYKLNERFAVQAAYNSGTHEISFQVPESVGGVVKGSSQIGTFSLRGKYYLKKRIFTPFFIGGLAQTSRDSRNYSSGAEGTDHAAGFELGVGAEYLMNKGRNFVTLQLIYNDTDFNGDDKKIQLIDDGSGDVYETNQTAGGSIVILQVGFGVRF